MSDKKPVISIITAMLIAVFCSADLSALDEAVIRWKPVHGAGGYILEIIDNHKKIVVEKEITGTVYDISKLSTGDYQYRLTTLNKLKKKGNSTGWIRLSIEKAIVPELAKVSRRSIDRSSGSSAIIVTGKNFLPDTRLYLKMGTEKIELKTVYISDSELKAELSPGMQIAGVYDLTAVNSGGFETVMKSAIKITDPKTPLVKSQEENSKEPEINDKTKSLPAGDLFYAGAGVDYIIPMGDWSSKIEPTIMAFHLYLSYPLSNAAFAVNIPVVRNLGAESFFSYSDYQLSDGTNGESFTKTSVFAGLNYPIVSGLFDPDFSLIFNLDGGAAYSILTVSTDGQSAEHTSLDPAVKAGVFLRCKWFNYIFTDISADYSRVFYKTHPLDESKISIRIGIII